MRTNFYLLIAMIAIIASCKKDGPAPDVELPTLTLTGVSANDTLRNTVSLEIKAQDAGGISKVDIFANDSLISTANGGDLKLSWNTLKSKDGDYTLKIVGTDASGNKKEMSLKVILSNALFKIEKALLESLKSQALKFIASDVDGKILASVSIPKGNMPSGDVLVYPKEAFTGDVISIIQVAQGTNYKLDCIVNQKRGYTLKYLAPTFQKFKNNENQIGPVKYTLSNVPAYDAIVVTGDRLGGAYTQTSNIMGTSVSKIFVQIEKGGSAKYNLYDFPRNVDPVPLNASLVTNPSAVKRITFPSAINGTVYVWGFVETGFSENYVFSDKALNGSSVDIYYAEGLTKQLGTNIIYTRNGIYFSHNYNGIPDNLKFMDVSAEFKNTSLSSFELNTSGKFDYSQVYFSNMTNYLDPAFIEIGIKVSNDLTKFKFPDLSAEIPGFKSKDFKIRAFRMYGGVGSNETVMATVPVP